MLDPSRLIAGKLVREVYRREILPERALWWLAAAGMRDWYRVLAKHLRPHFSVSEGSAEVDTRALLATLSKRMFERRYDALALSSTTQIMKKKVTLPNRISDPQAVPLLMSALYRSDARSTWIFKDLRPSPMRGRLLLSKLSVHERWVEVATHLGELLIVLTEDLPNHLPHARKILADICFDAGAKYAKRVKTMLGISDDHPDPPSAAMEILRMSEYVFRVNPEHWQHSDGESGWLEGNACLWWSRPGWNGAHCGIFGQFQSGIASVFGLRYHLSKTIPKHGGHTCRIDVKPIAAAAARGGDGGCNDDVAKPIIKLRRKDSALS